MKKRGEEKCKGWLKSFKEERAKNKRMNTRICEDQPKVGVIEVIETVEMEIEIEDEDEDEDRMRTRMRMKMRIG